LKAEKSKPEISLIFPCRNEEKTVGLCIEKARIVLDKYGRDYEIIVVDNASEDDSALVAVRYGAKLVIWEKAGYGNALRAGLKAAKGKYIIMCDCDMTYELADVVKILKSLTDGESDVVIGNRFAGGIEKGAMSYLHVAGVRFLSFLGRKRFKTDIYDFHCGLRGLTKKALKSMKLRCPGMEFSTELIAEAASKGLRLSEVPVSLKKCEYDRVSKLRTFRDGFRHLRYILFGRNAL